jgi:hypothetical protein
MGLKGSFLVSSDDKSHSPFATVSTDSQSGKSSTSPIEPSSTATISGSKIGASHFAALAYNARKARDHKAHMEFLDQ